MLIIKVQNLDSVLLSEYRVTVGGEECALNFFGSDVRANDIMMM